MRICFISHTPDLGGAERVLFETIDALRQLGVDCYVLLPGRGEFSDKLAEIGVPFDLVRAGSWITWGQPTVWGRTKCAVKILSGIIPTVKKVRDSQCDVVYSNTLAVLNGAIAAALLKRPHVWHLHEFPGYHRVVFQFGDRSSFRIVRSLSSVCLTVSKHAASKCEPYIGAAKLRTIYPSMHLADTATNGIGGPMHGPSGRLRCVIVGGLFETKRQEDAVQALGLLRRGDTDAELVIVGGGDSGYRRRLEELVDMNDVRAQVKFTGPVADAMSLMRAADLVLVCSEHESFGRVTIEAMLAGKPVVGARSAATPELIRDGFNGWLYEPRNVRDLATKIRLFCEDRSMACRLGANGRGWAERVFTKERYGRELLNVLMSLGVRRDSNLN